MIESGREGYAARIKYASLRFPFQRGKLPPFRGNAEVITFGLNRGEVIPLIIISALR